MGHITAAVRAEKKRRKVLAGTMTKCDNFLVPLELTE